MPVLVPTLISCKILPKFGYKYGPTLKLQKNSLTPYPNQLSLTLIWVFSPTLIFFRKKYFEVLP